MRLRELIDILWSAKVSGNEEEIRKAYNGLAEIGIYKTSADIILKEWHPENTKTDDDILEEIETIQSEIRKEIDEAIEVWAGDEHFYISIEKEAEEPYAESEYEETD